MKSLTSSLSMLSSNVRVSNVPPAWQWFVPSLSLVPPGVDTVAPYQWHRNTAASSWTAVFSLRVWVEMMSVGPTVCSLIYTVIQCYETSRNVMLYYFTQCYTTQHYTMLCYFMQCYTCTILRNITQCYATSLNVSQCYAMLQNVTLLHANTITLWWNTWTKNIQILGKILGYEVRKRDGGCWTVMAQRTETVGWEQVSYCNVTCHGGTAGFALHRGATVRHSKVHLIIKRWREPTAVCYTLGSRVGIGVSKAEPTARDTGSRGERGRWPLVGGEGEKNVTFHLPLL